MKPSLLPRIKFASLGLAACLLSLSGLVAQEASRVDKPFELNLSAAAFLKGMEGSLGFGGVLFAEPRYFVNTRMAITARFQGGGYFTLPVEPLADETNVNVTSILGGVLFRDRAKWNSMFWGVQTGLALTSEYVGTDPNGYAIYGDEQSFWVLQPRIGYAFGRFEMELSYHFSPAREARFGEFGLGVRLWGNKKPVDAH
jgi:hypothetical protein